MSATAAADPFQDGAPVLVGDPGDPVVFLAAAASRIDADGLERIQELAGGMTVLGVDESHARRLRLTGLPDGRRGDLGLELAAPVDAAVGIRGGWSLADRARTMRAAAAVGSVADDLTVPGHVHPARIGPDATPAAHGAIELSRFAGRATAVVLGAVCDRDGAPVSLADARELADLRRLPHASSAQLRARAIAQRAGGRTVSCALPTREGPFRAVALDLPDGEPECLALVHGDPAARPDPLVHVHVACLLGDALGSRRCACAAELDAARHEILAAGAGVILHVAPPRPGLAVCPRESSVDLAPGLALLSAIGVQGRGGRSPTLLLGSS